MDKMGLGQRICEARKSHGWTQETLAEQAGIGVMYLGEIERGIKAPSMKVFIKLLNALEIPADYVLRYEVLSGKEHVFDEMTQKLVPLTPKQRKTALDILDAYISNLEI